MANSFDPFDRSSWYFGAMNREEATNLLTNEKEGGVFFIRDSNSCKGDYVLCVREDSKVSQYIIHKEQKNDHAQYKIGEQSFRDLPSLLAFYKVHYLDTTALIRPAIKKVQKVIAKFDFDGVDVDDLPFKKGEILTIISKDEDQWWTAKNALGYQGSIPVPYVQKYDDSRPNITNHNHIENLKANSSLENTNAQNDVTLRKNQMQRKLPAFARVKQVRIPNAYDKTALKLEIGDIIKVTKMNINGQWEGELNGKVGHFPFTHVEFVDNNKVVDS